MKRILLVSSLLLWLSGSAAEMLFQDDFSLSADKWVNGEKASVVKGSFLVKGDGKSTAVVWTKKGEDWTDYVVEFDAVIRNRQVGWLVRKNKNGYYMFLLRGPYLNRLVYNKKFISCGKTPLEPAVAPDKKVHVKIVAAGNTIKHYIDGKLVDTLVDGTHSSGSFGFRECGAEAGIFDNVVIRKQDAEDIKSEHEIQALATIPFTAQAPEIDGSIGKQEWHGAAVLGGFSDLSGKTSGKPTTVYVKWDNEKLYLAFRSKKRFVREVLKCARDDNKIFSDDAIEINLAPGGNKWFKMVFNPDGSKWDKIFTARSAVKDNIWNPLWEVANKLIHDDYYVQDVWEAEAAIPFKSLGFPPPKPGQLWRVQLCRDYDDTKNLGYPLPQRWTAWDPGVNFQDPESFGKFIFVKNKPVFQLDGIAEITAGLLGITGKLVDTGDPAAEVLMKGGIANDPSNQFLNKKFRTGDDVKVSVAAKINEKCVVDYNWSVNVGNEAVAAGRVRGLCAPPFSVTLAPLYTANKMWADGDISRLPELPQKRKVCITFSDVSNRKLLEISEDISGKDKFLIPIDISKIIPGEFKVAIKLLDLSGKTLAETGKKLNRPANPIWNQGTELGKFKSPPPGWTELKTAGSGSETVLSTFGKEYIYERSALPKRITIHQKPFLAAPAELIINSKPVKIIDFKILSSSNIETKISWSGKSTDGKLDVSGKIMVGFDGLIWNDLMVKSSSAAPGELDDLSISLPLVRKHLRYLRGRNNMDFLDSIGMRYLAFIGDAKITDAKFPQPADRGNLSVNGWKWNDKFCNFYWVGGVDYGMFAMFKSPHNLQTAQYSSITEADDRITLTFPLVSSPLEINSSGKRYEFGFIGTPVRKIGDRNRLQRAGFNHFYKYDPAHFEKALGRVWGSGPLKTKFFTGPKIDVKPGDVATQVIQCGLTCSLGNPYIDHKQKQQLASLVELTGKMQIAPLLWVDLTYTPITMKNEFPFRYEWEQYPRQRHIGTAASYSLVCPQEPWHNFYLYGVSKLLKESKVKGFYLDMTGYGSCNNKYHGCGYVGNGKLLGEVPILKLRDLFLKFWNVTHQPDPQNTIIQHGQVLTPCALWTDVVTQGENWAGVRNKGDLGYQTLSLPYYQLAYMPQRQYGVQFNWFSTLNTPSYVHELKNIISLEEVVGLALLHDNLPIGQTSQQVPGLVTCWNAMTGFGAYEKDTLWSPYWENKLGDWKHGIAVSYYRRGKDFLIVAFNTSYKKELAVELPVKLFGNGTAYNVINGQNEPFNKLTVKPRKTKLLIIKRN